MQIVPMLSTNRPDMKPQSPRCVTWIIQICKLFDSSKTWIDVNVLECIMLWVSRYVTWIVQICKTSLVEKWHKLVYMCYTVLSVQLIVCIMMYNSIPFHAMKRHFDLSDRWLVLNPAKKIVLMRSPKRKSFRYATAIVNRPDVYLYW